MKKEAVNYEYRPIENDHFHVGYVKDDGAFVPEVLTPSEQAAKSMVRAFNAGELEIYRSWKERLICARNRWIASKIRYAFYGLGFLTALLIATFKNHDPWGGVAAMILAYLVVAVGTLLFNVIEWTTKSLWKVCTK